MHPSASGSVITSPSSSTGLVQHATVPGHHHQTTKHIESEFRYGTKPRNSVQHPVSSPCIGAGADFYMTYHPHLNALHSDQTTRDTTRATDDARLSGIYLRTSTLRATHRYHHYRDLPELLSSQDIITQREILAQIITCVGSNSELKFFAQCVDFFLSEITTTTNAGHGGERSHVCKLAYEFRTSALHLSISLLLDDHLDQTIPVTTESTTTGTCTYTGDIRAPTAEPHRSAIQHLQDLLEQADSDENLHSRVACLDRADTSSSEFSVH